MMICAQCSWRYANQPDGLCSFCRKDPSDPFVAKLNEDLKKLDELSNQINTLKRSQAYSNPELLERCAAAVHRAYCKNYLKRKGVAYWTGGDYSKLDEETKEIDRSTVRAVFAELEIK